ncbi:acid protease [Neofusicoccum parvum]|nr:acid protease [Neofusicoccum parvum]
MAANHTGVSTPYVVNPTYEWDGIDGNWSTFCISAGKPSQEFRVLISTRAPASWLPIPDGCWPSDPDCPDLRGVEPFESNPSRGFQYNKSSTWIGLGIYNLGLEENLGIAKGSGGIFGYDSVRLGLHQDTDALEVENAEVVGVANESYYLGLLGLSNAETFLSNTAEPIKSLIEILKDHNKIPSLSYGYTAGAYYRFNKVAGSLVIGGYDQSRFTPPIYNFAFASDLDRFLQVGIQSIFTTFSLNQSGPANLVLSHGHFSLIDSTVSHLWLPGEVCDNFATAFNLTYDAEENYYLISDTVRQRLLAENITLSFKLGNDHHFSTNDSIEIKLPYDAFDLFIRPPAYPNTTRYFPIRRASNDTQYTIGRAFLQEAYLTVDYEHQNFSLAQANFLTDPSRSQDIRKIFSTDYVAPTPPSELSSGAKAGIAIGALAGLLILFGALYLCWYRPRRTEQVRRHAIPPNYAEGKPYNPFYATGGPEQPPSEMLASTGHQGPRPELEGAGVGGGSYELPASAGAAREGWLHEMDAGNGDAADGEGGGEEGTERERRASAAVAPTER